MEDRKDRKWPKLFGNILFTIFIIFMAFLIIVTAKTRFTGGEPKLFGYRFYIVNSGSMSPTIDMDSMIIVKETDPQYIDRGDIVTYYGHDRDSKVTHRVVEIEGAGTSFITRGDANDSNDPIPLEGNKLIGKVIISIPWIGKVFRFLNTRLGVIIIGLLITLWIVVPMVSQKFKQLNKPVGLCKLKMKK